ncbi:MAG TPA: bifunctional 4-hydroxy-2-oxoglutarate aldolase/2-dehydro-3-deoxy-phosphogluconate aldolase [Puia sp.]|jgi:2-dehydro-3-deoxyphosphogluconate aldolase/(4S)-4-hydroxy-2-oxoglutarate aldolase
MSKKEEIKNLVVQQGLLPLYYNDNSEVSIEILRTLYKAGIRIIEYTNRGEHALDNFLLMKKTAKTEMPDMKLGIGTIKTKTDAEIFIAASVDFIVCPVVDISIAEIVHKAGLLWIPGCMTATEINTAEINGASLVKIFPGNILGPTYISSIKEIFPNLLFMPTGGVEMSKENIQSWFNAGVSAVGMGSKLITKSIMENKDYKTLTENCVQALALVIEAKKL